MESPQTATQTKPKKASDGSRTYRQLYSKHAEYDPILNRKLCLLYEGGFTIQKHAELFLDRISGLESSTAYTARKKCVSYLPYLSEFITQFGASLFSDELECKPPGDADDSSTSGKAPTDDFYKEFAADCDMKGRSLHQFMKDSLECALHQLNVYVGLDFPRADPNMPEPTNRLQEKEMGRDRAYLYTIPYENVIDYKIDPRTGKFIWLKTFEECFPDDDPLAEPRHYFKFGIWTDIGHGHYESWESHPVPLKDVCKDSTKFYKEDVIDTSVPQIPIWCLSIPKGYHVGQQIGSVCQEHYQRRSFMVSNANKTCVSIGFFGLGPEITAPGDALPPDIQMPETSSAFRAKLENDGWVVGRVTDKWSDTVQIVEAKGDSHKFIAEDLTHLVEQMMQTLRQMNMTAAANMKAQGRSAASKAIDQHGTSMLLSVYDQIVKAFVGKFMRVLSQTRKEDIRWVVDGLSIAEPVQQRPELVEELTKLGIDILKLPPMFKNKYLYRLANELLEGNLSDTEKLQLQEKIQEAVESGEFDAIDPEEAAAAGNKMAQVTSSREGQAGPAAPDAPAPLPVGKTGQPQLPEGTHLQSGQHVDWQEIYKDLEPDYPKPALKWVKQVPWRGPVEVPVSSIDFHGEDKWKANQPGPNGLDKVQKYAEEMADKGFESFNPVILANTPHNDQKFTVIDGRHRVKAAQQTGLPLMAYIADVGSMDPDTDHMKMHDAQTGSSSNMAGS